MSDIAIRVVGIGKRYWLGPSPYHGQLRDTAAAAASSGLEWLRFGRSTGGSRQRVLAAEHDFLWAVRDVTFEVRQGEAVGIIGRNGAGKSTLLRLLAKITAPTTGYAEVRGRVGTLLDVGVGFHPELTGRENVYLNGAIMGMKSAEIARKFEEIIAFAEIDRFVDTPLKHYSSGMHVRLAFAIAAHLESDILLVDEALAVGDSQFQRKCLGKMNDVARGGRTVLFISHQLSLIRRLCERALWLDRGRLRAFGATPDVVAQYEGNDGTPEEDHERRHCFLSWELDGGGHIIVDGLERVTFCFALRLPSPVVKAHVGFYLYNDKGLLVGGWAFDGLSLSEGLQELVVEFPELPLRPGVYSLWCAINEGGMRGRRIEAWGALPYLRVESVVLGHPQDDLGGVINLPASVTVRPASARPGASTTLPVQDVR